MKKAEIKYYGLHACLAIWARRPQDIIRVYLDESNVKILGPLLKWCAKNKKAYHIVPDSDLNKVSDSIHHEGVCILANNLPSLSFDEFKASLIGKEKCCALYLDGVQNPHNIGSILRTCAHFGMTHILGEKGKLPALSPSCCRIAKGGAEIVRLVALEKPILALTHLKKQGFSLLSTSSHEGSSLYCFKFPAKSILAIGSESHGVDRAILSLANQSIQIPGSGQVESLNVAVASGLCLGEYCRQHL